MLFHDSFILDKQKSDFSAGNYVPYPKTLTQWPGIPDYEFLPNKNVVFTRNVDVLIIYNSFLDGLNITDCTATDGRSAQEDLEKSGESSSHCLLPGSVQACVYWKPQLNCPLRSLNILQTVRSALLKVDPRVYIDNRFFNFPRTSLRTQQLFLVVKCSLESKSCLTENAQLLRLGSQLFLRLTS